MDSISHMPSPRSFSNSFHCWLNLFAFHSTGVSQQFWWCFPSSFQDRRRVFPLNLVCSLEDSWFQLHIILSIYFSLSDVLSYPSVVCQELFFRFFSPEAIILVIVLYLSRRFIQMFFNQLMISSFFCS